MGQRKRSRTLQDQLINTIFTESVTDIFLKPHRSQAAQAPPPCASLVPGDPPVRRLRPIRFPRTHHVLLVHAGRGDGGEGVNIEPRRPWNTDRTRTARRGVDAIDDHRRDRHVEFESCDAVRENHGDDAKEV